MPSILKVEQHIADSLRAVEWFKITKDSSYIRKFKNTTPAKKDTSAPKEQRVVHLRFEAIDPKEYFISVKKIITA